MSIRFYLTAIFILVVLSAWLSFIPPREPISITKPIHSTIPCDLELLHWNGSVGPRYMDRDVELQITSMTKTIPKGTPITFEETGFTFEREYTTLRDISPGDYEKITLKSKLSKSYLDLPDFFKVNIASTIFRSNTCEFPVHPAHFAKNLIEWSPKTLNDYSWRWWLPEPIRIRVENFFGPLCINTGFFGVMGSGKTTFQHTLMTALLNEQNEIFDPLSVSGGQHHTTEIVSGFEIPRVEKLPSLKLILWDTFGVQDDVNWPEHSFRDFLKGSLKTFSRYDPVQATKSLYSMLFNTLFPPSPLDRIHQINFFMKMSTIKNEKDLNKMTSLRTVAGKEGFNPFLFVTFEGDIPQEEKDELLKNYIPKEFPMQTVFFAPYSITRNSKTDRQTLEIIRLIQLSSEAQLARVYPLPTGSERMKEFLLFSSYFIFLVLLCLSFLNKIEKLIYPKNTQRRNGNGNGNMPRLVQAEGLLDDDNNNENDVQNHNENLPRRDSPVSRNSPRNSPNNRNANSAPTHGIEKNEKNVDNPNAVQVVEQESKGHRISSGLSDSVSDEEIEYTKESNSLQNFKNQSNSKNEKETAEDISRSNEGGHPGLPLYPDTKKTD